MHCVALNLVDSSYMVCVSAGASTRYRGMTRIPTDLYTIVFCFDFSEPFFALLFAQFLRLDVFSFWNLTSLSDLKLRKRLISKTVQPVPNQYRRVQVWSQKILRQTMSISEKWKRDVSKKLDGRHLILKQTGETREKAAKIRGNSDPTPVARDWLRG